MLTMIPGSVLIVICHGIPRPVAPSARAADTRCFAIVLFKVLFNSQPYHLPCSFSMVKKRARRGTRSCHRYPCRRDCMAEFTVMFDLVFGNSS